MTDGASVSHAPTAVNAAGALRPWGIGRLRGRAVRLPQTWYPAGAEMFLFARPPHIHLSRERAVGGRLLRRVRSKESLGPTGKPWLRDGYGSRRLSRRGNGIVSR